MPASGTRRRSGWVSLSEASSILGIAPGTLRRWANEGSVAVFTTPGGHRRFSRRAISALLPAERPRRPTLARLGASPERIARAYRSRRSRPGPDSAPWLDALSDETRSVFRERGRELVAVLLEHLDTADDGVAPGDGPRALRLREAERLAALYGREVAALGSSLSEAVEGFLRFRAPFTDELALLARRRGLDTREATALLSDAEAAMDRLLIAMMTGHTLEGGARRQAGRDRRDERGPREKGTTGSGPA